MASKREYSQRVDQIAKDFEEEKQMTFEITQDMTRQYKAMQEELLGRVSIYFKSYIQCLLKFYLITTNFC